MKDLQTLAEEYIKAKKEENLIKKETSKLNTKIKKIMSEEDIKSLDTPVGRLELSQRTSESFDEENLIEYLKSSGNARGLVKKKEYVDFDALESAIYREKLDIDTIKKLNDYKITKVSNVLSVK